MANAAPHDLALAVADLAAPRLAPSACVVQLLSANWQPRAVLLLRIRPRELAAGLEIAVHSGDPAGATDAEMSVRGALYDVPATPAGIQRFADDLVGGGGWGCADASLRDDYGRLKLQLSPVDDGPNWRGVVISLTDPSYLWISGRPNNADFFSLYWPHPTNGVDARVLGFSDVSSEAFMYTHEQHRLRSRRGRARAAAPDSPVVYREKRRQLVDADMAALRSALASTLGLACRYRGQIDMPLPPPPAPPAAAGQGSQPAGA